MDAAELKDVMGRYRDLVYRIAYTYLRNPADADDVTQDVFVQLMKCDVAFESDEHVRRWLARVAINRCKSLFSHVLALDRKHRRPCAVAIYS